ncbi:MAG TPA: peptidylprolyl isomerase [Pirellulales bacterium]|nr:peptidylprolyl isomerase [Pirellulales bacterium]
MPLSRSATDVLLALACFWPLLAGCNRSSPPPEEQATANTDTDTADDNVVSGAPAEKRGKAAKPLDASAAYYPTVVLKTSLGDLTIKLDPQAAPRTVHNFLHYVESGHYNQTIFHQIDAGYVALGGAYTPDLVERQSRYPIPNEAANGRKNVRGTIAMARSIDDIDSSTCQFFINLAENPHLDHRGERPEEYGFCVFGEVTEGLDVLDKISAIEVQDKDDFKKLPVETVLIETAYRVR